MERVLNQLVEKLTKTHGDRLVSVVLYGSAAVGEHHGRFSDINVFCVLNQVTPRELGDSEPIFRWWRGLGNPAPLLMSVEEVRTSTDCFPIEFHDIKERHRIVQGEDLVTSLDIDDSFYRAQVEHELRAKLLRLRQKGAGVLSDRHLLLRLMAESLSTFTVLARHALRLAGHDAPFSKREIIARAGERFGVEAEPFLALLDFREEKRKERSLDPPALYDRYLRGVQTLVDAVDRLDR